MNEKLPFYIWVEILSCLDFKDILFLYRNFKNIYQLRTHILDKIHDYMSKYSPRLKNTIDFHGFNHSILNISLTNLVQNYGFVESMFAILDGICFKKRHSILITTQNNFVFHLLKKTNHKVILFYEVKDVDNLCYLILYRNKDMKRQYGKLFEKRDNKDHKTFCERVFYL